MNDHPLRPLLNPASIAVVGASPREGSLGHITIEQALHPGFSGSVYPINPRYATILGTACYPGIGDLPAPPELVILATGNRRIETQLVEAIEQGVKAAVIFASAYLENDQEPLLVHRLSSIAREAGMPICGANCLGFCNVETGVRAHWAASAELEPGPITMVSHSGTAYFSFASIDPRLRFNLLVSPGQELATTAADYLDYALTLASTRVVGLLLETVRDPAGFLSALDKARARKIPVVVLKVGQTELSAKLAQSHSGALAGNDAAYEAVFEHCGVQRVQSMDELGATLALFSACPQIGPGKLSALHDSGGLRGMVIDLAHNAGVPYAQINEETTAILKRTLAYGLPAVNPVDGWGGFEGHREVFITCLQALANDPDTAITFLFTDIPSGDSVSKAFMDLVPESAAQSGKPIGLVLNWSRQRALEVMTDMTRRGTPVLDGAGNAILAVKHAFAHRDFLARGDINPPPAPEPVVVERWRERLSTGVAFDEAESSALLTDFGLPMVAARVASRLDNVLAAARELGYPVVLKTAEPGINHKTDVRGVKAGLADEHGLQSAYTDLATRLGPRVLVAPMVEDGVELALGVIVDDQFGPLVMVGAGGVLIELLEDRRFILPPIDDAAAARAVTALKSAALLEGVRGAGPVDKTSLYGAIAALGVLATELGDQLAEIDVNPLIATPLGCTAVDALVIPHGG